MTGHPEVAPADWPRYIVFPTSRRPACEVGGELSRICRLQPRTVSSSDHQGRHQIVHNFRLADDLEVKCREKIWV